jgi:hypothetical protein
MTYMRVVLVHLGLDPLDDQISLHPRDNVLHLGSVLWIVGQGFRETMPLGPLDQLYLVSI